MKENGFDYVDLGLPSCTMWAPCNVGADKPEDPGCSIKIYLNGMSKKVKASHYVFYGCPIKEKYKLKFK